MSDNSPERLRALLESARTVAVVGASGKPDRPAHTIPLLLRQLGFTVIPVNPQYETLFDGPCYPTLADVPGTIDAVDVFRRSQDCPMVAQEAAAKGARILWLQLGILCPQAEAIARDAGMEYVEDNCMGATARLLGVRHGREGDG